jgi:hypothetical protein
MSNPVPGGSLNPPPAGAPSYVPAHARPQRGRRLRWVTFWCAVVFAGLLGLSSFLFLYSVDLISTDPIADSGTWLMLLVVATVGSVVTFAMSVVAAAYCRPKPMALLTFALSAALPAATFVGAVYLGLTALQAHAVADLQVVGDDVEVVTALLDAWDVEAAPVRSALDAVANVTG